MSLKITIPAQEQWNEMTEQFMSTKEQTLILEHSLVSISKWESKWQKPFLGKGAKSAEETIDYVRCMTINQVNDPNVYYNLTQQNMDDISSYIDSPMSATWFSEEQKRGGGSKEVVTSELIYYWMVALEIPFECQKWHLNRLLTLIRIANIKNQPSKKMSKAATRKQNHSLNAARRARLHSKG